MFVLIEKIRKGPKPPPSLQVNQVSRTCWLAARVTRLHSER